MSEFETHTYQDRLGLKNRDSRAAWGVVYLLLFRLTPRWALHGWRRTVLRMFGAKIGERVGV